MPIVYVNQVGGQDELVFDGGSMIVDATGTVVARADQFVEAIMVADVEPLAPHGGDVYPVTVVTEPVAAAGEIAMPLAPVRGRLDALWHALVLGTRDYVHKNGFTDICLGLSGGIDSSLVAAIAADALGPDNVHTVAMPSRYSSEGSLSDAAKLAAALGVDHRVVPIEAGHSAFLDMLAPSFAGREADVTEENLQSRIRGVLLMALSNKFGWLVLTTGNKSETAVGYSTLYGDTAGAFAVIKDVWKLDVYELCRWRNATAGREIIPSTVIDKPPSAELRPDQRDDQSLPPYEVLDPLLIELVENDRIAAEIIADGHDEATVARLARLVDIAEYKRRQNPIGPKVSTKAFGRDRRMPDHQSLPRADAVTSSVCRASPHPSRRRREAGDPNRRRRNGLAQEPHPARRQQGMLMTDTAPTSLDVLADRLGALAWISDALFVLQGRWAETMADDRTVEHLATASRHKGWHVELLVDLLPDSPALRGADRIVAPSGWEVAVLLGADAVGDPARLAVLYRALVPRVVGQVARTRTCASGPGDATIARMLGFVATDLVNDLVTGSALLDAALVDEAAVRVAHEAVVGLDLAFANR